jgi:hypothetical protein
MPTSDLDALRSYIAGRVGGLLDAAARAEDVAAGLIEPTAVVRLADELRAAARATVDTLAVVNDGSDDGTE